MSVGWSEERSHATWELCRSFAQTCHEQCVDTTVGYSVAIQDNILYIHVYTRVCVCVCVHIVCVCVCVCDFVDDFLDYMQEDFSYYIICMIVSL